VSSRIGMSIIEFCRTEVGHQFYAEDLRKWVDLRAGPVAPGSADRILRDLRQRGFIDYVVVNRAHSLYQLTGLTDALDLV